MATSTTILDHYKHYTFHPDVLPAGGIAVLSRFPITNKELIQSPVGWFPAQLVIVHTPVRDIQVLNLHLKPPLTAFPNPLPLPHAYVMSKKERVRECLLYATYIDMYSPLVVLGDFNEDVSSESAKVWTHKLGLKNAYDTPKEDDKLAKDLLGKVRDDITWNWPLPLNITLKAKFDHIFYQGLTCLKYGVKLSGESDHYPIFAHFKFL